jgi:hypothetical protein
MNEKRQTAIEWLAEQMMHPEIHNPYIAQAKEMEKEQIENACDSGFKDGVLYASGEIWIYESSEQYYNENFKK